MISPVVFSIGSFSLFWYSIFLILAIVFAVYSFWKRAQEEDFEDETIFDLAFVTLAGALIGGRIIEVVIRFNYFSQEILSPLFFTTYPGFSFSGLLLGGLIALYFACKSKKVSLLTILDLVIVGLPLSQALIFVGHFLNGSFFGTKTNLFWGISVSGLIDKHHPIQLLAVFYFLILALFLTRLARRKQIQGRITSIWLIFSSLFLLLIDPLRADGVYLKGVSVRLVLALAFLLVSTLCHYLFVKKSPIDDLKAIWNLAANRNCRKEVISGLLTQLANLRFTISRGLRKKVRLVLHKK